MMIDPYTSSLRFSATFALLKVNLLLLLLSASCQEEVKQSNSNGQRQLQVDIAVLKGEKIENVIVLPASVLPFEEVVLYAEIPGRIQEIFFQEGDFVKQGSPLVKIDSDILKAKKAQVESNLNFALKEEARSKSLYEVEAGSLETYELAQSKVAALEAEIKAIGVEIEKTIIRAPFSGNIGLRQISPGAYISTSDPIARIAQQDPLKIEFTVSQRYANKVSAGQIIEVKDKNERTVGQAEVYASDPTIESATRSLKVRAKIEKNDALFPGGFVQVAYNLGTMENSFMIPSSAVSPVLSGQQIWIIKNGKASPRIVELGIRTSEKVQIIGDIQAGDTVITSGLLSMREGLSLSGKTKDAK
jgi:membrane fusion protein (multidrug efflux system)